MRNCSAATAALLANPPPGLRSADLFTFTLRDGVTIYRWTSYDRDLTVNGDVYSSRKPWLQRSRWSVANTMQVPTLEVQLLALNDAFGGGLDIKGQLTHGLFDGAAATLDRVFFTAGTTVINDTGGGPSTGSVDYSWTTWTHVCDQFTSNNGNIVLAMKPALGTCFSFSATFAVTINYGDPIPGAWDGVMIGGLDGFGRFANWGAEYDRISAGPGTPGIRLFGGNVANIDITGNSATINVKGKSNLLDQYAPRNLYQLGCEHAFCDAGCTLLRASYTTSYTVGSGSGGATRTFIPWSSAPGTPNRYRYGTVTFTTGVCAGQARTVRLGDSTGLTLTQPLLGTPAAGDSFTAFEGCDKQKDSSSGQDCTARSNTQHWRAFPYVPPADSAA